MKNTKIFLLLCLSAVFSYGCAGKIGIKKESQYIVDDKDTVCFTTGMFYVPISGAIYNALDKQYITDRGGMTIEMGTWNWRDESQKIKAFRMVQLPSRGPDSDTPANAINAARTWYYRINELPAWEEVRYFASALMPRAIEKVEYKAYDKPNEGKNGIVNITTRNPDKTKSDVRSTLYLLNGIEITEKIFDAINPVYIKSLKRITDKTELLQYNKSRLKEVVKVETFTFEEIIAPKPLIFADGGHLKIFLVNGIRLDEKSYQAINRNFFKEWYCIRSYNKEIIPYLKKYPKAVYIELGVID